MPADRLGQTNNFLKLPFVAPKTDREHAANARQMEQWANRIPVAQGGGWQPDFVMVFGMNVDDEPDADGWFRTTTNKAAYYGGVESYGKYYADFPDPPSGGGPAALGVILHVLVSPTDFEGVMETGYMRPAGGDLGAGVVGTGMVVFNPGTVGASTPSFSVLIGMYGYTAGPTDSFRVRFRDTVTGTPHEEAPEFLYLRTTMHLIGPHIGSN